MEKIKIYSTEQIQKIAQAGKLAAQTLDTIAPFIKEGISTLEINELCDNFTKLHGGTSAPLEVTGYHHAICTSLNDEICHGIPSPKIKLKKGDIINVDVTVNLDGYYGDTSRMYAVGEISPAAQKLIDTTYKSLQAAISAVKPGKPFSVIGRAIEEVVHPHGYGIVEDFCGHGIGTVFHEAPNVLHYYHPLFDRLIMKEGMVFTIEPMINASASIDYFMDKNKWTAYTRDGALSAQFEHTVVVTNKGCKILTKI